MKGFAQVSLASMLDTIGEDETKIILSSYECPYNRDVERFLRETSIMFDRQGISKTHLVFCGKGDQVVLVGYYTLSNKMFTIYKRSKLNSRTRQRLAKFAAYNQDLDRHEITAPLIGQLGKNFKNGYDKLISGDELLKLACDKIREMQQIVGGKVAYLECENIPSLIRFYESNGFYVFDHRSLDAEETADYPGNSLVQMLRYF